MGVLLLSLLLESGGVVYTEPYVDVPPRCTLYVHPPSPDSDTSGGLVVLHVLVNAEGEAESTEVWLFTDSSYIKPALDASKFFRFTPARVEDKEVSCWTVVAVPFVPLATPLLADSLEEGELRSMVLKIREDRSIEFFTEGWERASISPAFLKRIDMRKARPGHLYLVGVPAAYLRGEPDSTLRVPLKKKGLP